MARRDIFHETVKQVLIKDGWTITHDPYVLAFGAHKLYIDLGAERPLAAEKDDRKIAVEIKSFIGDSEVDDLERALGQYNLYTSLLGRSEPERKLYLAISTEAYDGIFNTPLGRVAIEDYRISLLVFDEDQEVVSRWIDSPSIGKS